MTNDERPDVERLVQRARSDPESVPLDEIESALGHSDETVREGAATALHAVSRDFPERAVDAVDRLSPLLESDRATLRSKALATMANAGDRRPEALVPHGEAIVASLDDESPTVNRSAARALRAVTTVEAAAASPAVPRLVALLDADVQSTRAHAATILKRVAVEDPGAVHSVVEPLLAAVEETFDRPTGITYEPSPSSGGAGPTEQMRGFRALTEDPEGRSSNAAAREAAAASIATLADDDPVRVADALDGHLSRSFDLLDDRNPTVRATTVEALGSVAEADPAAVRPAEEELIGLLEDARPVRERAVRVLGALETERARAALADLASDDDADVVLRVAAQRALGAGQD